MPSNSKKNFISIAKAIGIILMVVGHSGCPVFIGRFLYLFHMPLFFVCSGFFFKEITDRPTLFNYYLKKIKGLYLPYIKWSVLFLLFHNVFHSINIIDSYLYKPEDYIRQFARLVVMADYELLIRPFWFIKELLLASIVVATISLFRSRILPKLSIELLLAITLIISILAKTIPTIPLLGDFSLLLFCITYYYSGVLLHKYLDYIPFTYSLLIATFLTILLGSFLFKGNIDMRFTTIHNIFLYYLLSLIGILMILCASKKLEKHSNSSFLYYIGNHTMPILALNLLALKIGNLIKIWFYNMPIEKLSSYTVIFDNNISFWLIYTLIGVTIPLLMHYIYNRIVIYK